MRGDFLGDSFPRRTFLGREGNLSGEDGSFPEAFFPGEFFLKPKKNEH